MMVIVVVEGLDRVGKSTLCTKLKTSLNYPLVDFSKELSSPIREYPEWKLITEALFAAEYLMVKNRAVKNAIFQRFYPTREAYRKIIPRKLLLSNIDPEHELPTHILVYLTATVTFIRQREESLGEKYDISLADSLKKELNSYIFGKAAYFKNVRLLVYDVEVDKTDEIIKDVRDAVFEVSEDE